MQHNLLTNVFNILIENKKFPNYQAERRIDIFINYFLEKILREYLGKSIEYVCPEFPIKKEGSNLSTKLDYLCKSEDEIIFVELKTDASSLKAEQAEIYLNCNWAKCKLDLQEIIKSVKNKTHLEKYNTLNAVINKINVSNENPDLRIVYISPLPSQKLQFTKAIKILNPKKISDLSTPIQPEDQILWSLIGKLDLYVFEIVKSH
jgi:hypothetical protein